MAVRRARIISKMRALSAAGALGSDSCSSLLQAVRSSQAAICSPQAERHSSASSWARACSCSAWLGGLNSGKESVNLSCPDANQLEKLADAFSATKEVHVEYLETAFSGIGSGETGNFVVNVTVKP